MSSFQNLILRVGADVSALKQQLYRARTEIKGFNSFVQGQMSQISAALTGTVLTLGIGAAIQDAVKVEGALEQVKRLMGESADEFIAFSKTSSEALGISRSEALDYGRTYANLTSIFTKSTEETMQTTQELMKASAIVSSATGRSMEDVMFRIRSGLLGNTEAVEDLGVTVYINMIEASDAMKKFANGRSWNQLEFRLQQQIRHYAILEQVQKKFGDEVFKNTGFRINQFSAALKDLRLELGNAFLPIVNVVLPYLTAFTRRMTTAMESVAAFSRALFGVTKEQATIKKLDSTNDTIKDTGDSASDSAKKLKGFLAGFDEINAVPQVEAGAAVKKEDQEMGDPQLKNPFVDTMEETKTKAGELGKAVRDVFTGMADTAKENSDLIIAALSGIGVAFSGLMLTLGTQELLKNLPTILTAVRTALTGVTAAITFLTSPIGLIVLAISALTAVFVYFYRTNEDFAAFVDSTLLTAWNNIKSAVEWLYLNVFVPFGAFLSDFTNNVLSPLGAVLSDVLSIAFNTLYDIGYAFYVEVIQPLSDFLRETFGPIVELISAHFENLWKNILKPLGELIKNVFIVVLGDLAKKFNELYFKYIKPFAEYLGTKFKEGFISVFKKIGEEIEAFKTIVKGVITFLTGVFKGDWKLAWEGLSQIVEGIFKGLVAIVKTPVNAIIDIINKLITGINGISFELPDFMGGGKFGGTNISQIPKLARGGIINSPTMAMIGEAGSEMVVPLENTSFVDKLSSALGTAVMSAMQMNSGMNRNENREVVIKIDGNTLARAINPYTTKESSRVGTSILSIS